jgi:hypothetical protein
MACGAAEFVGMVAAASAYLVSGALVGDPTTWPAALLTLVIIVTGGVVEGAAVGWTQAWMLRRWLSELSMRAWVGVTVLVAAAGWLLGAAPSVVVSVLGESTNSGAQADEPSAIIMPMMGLGAGLVMGSVFGVAQSLVLRRYVQNAHLWIAANALGWGLAMSVMFLGASAPDAYWSTTSILATAALTGVLSGMCVGGVTGAFLPGLRLRTTAKVSAVSG